MKKTLKVITLMLTVLLFGMGAQVELSATPGKLRSDSICTNRGVAYGKHGDGHWHKAEKRSNGWYPVGESLGYKNPCARRAA